MNIILFFYKNYIIVYIKLYIKYSENIRFYYYNILKYLLCLFIIIILIEF